MSGAASYVKSHKTFFFILLTILLGIILRVYGLSTHYYWYDEIITLEVAHGDLESIIFGKRPPLYLALAHFWIGNIGYTEETARLLSIIFGVGSIALIYLVGKSLFNPTVGLISAFFMSVSKFQIHYSQELRYYSLFEFFTLVSFYFYIRFLRSRSNIDAILYILSSILLYYSHDFGIFIIAAQNLYLLIRIKTYRKFLIKWILSQVVVFIGISPKFISSFTGKAIGEGGPNWIPPPDQWAPLDTISIYLSPAFEANSQLVVYISLGVLIIGTLAYILILGTKKWAVSVKKMLRGFKTPYKMKSETILVLLWFIVPIALVLILSEILKPMYLNRYLICSAPALYILAALLLTKIDKVIPVVVLLLTFAVLIAPGLYYYKTTPLRPDWNEVGTYIKEQDKGGTSVVLMSFINLPSFNWYNIGKFKIDKFKYCPLPKHSLYQSMLFKYCKVEGYDHFWAVLEKEQIGRYWKHLYRYNSNLYRVETVKEFSGGQYSPVLLISFQKVKQ